MQKILVLGAGRSSGSLIQYLLDQSAGNDWQVTVADQQEDMARQKTGSHPHAIARSINIQDGDARVELIQEHHLVVSLLPPHLHILAARDCLTAGKHLVTASYVSPEMAALREEVKKAGILFMCEMGLDPGIDHMSAMRIIHALKERKVEILSFRSATGGLVALESDNNPWHYKITWNPRNVVLAGQGAAQYLEKGKTRYIPYQRLFTQTEITAIPGYGRFEAYANRDSLHYIDTYGLQGVPDILRATFRRPGYCEAWNALLKLGWTDDSYQLHLPAGMTYAGLTEAFLPPDRKSQQVRKRMARWLHEKPGSGILRRLEWLGIFEETAIGITEATPAVILQQLLEKKMKMGEQDKDLIVMQHHFRFREEGKEKEWSSVMVLKGRDQHHTAMADTVGLPMGILTKKILEGSLKLTGVQIPVMPEVYIPVLKELETLGVVFQEKEKKLKGRNKG